MEKFSVYEIKRKQLYDTQMQKATISAMLECVQNWLETANNRISGLEREIELLESNGNQVPSPEIVS